MNLKGIRKSWNLDSFFESREYKTIERTIKEEKKKGLVVVPKEENIFRVFSLLDREDVKVAIFGLAPYHTIHKGSIVADGIALSCSNTNFLQPSLEVFYNSMEKELNKKLNRNPNLEYIVKKGVLLTNVSLTTIAGMPSAHLSLWTPFIKYLFEKSLNNRNILTISLGKEAGIIINKYHNPLLHGVHIKVEHPAVASYNRSREWKSNGIFNIMKEYGVEF